MGTHDVLRLLNRVTAPLRHRLNMVVARMVLDAVSDAAQRQGMRVTVLADEVLDDIEHFQPGGLTHVPLKGAEGVLVCVGGQRGHAIALGVANRDARPTGLQPGETGLYAAQPGTGGLKVLLDAAGNITLTPTATVTITGALLVTGEIAAMTAAPGTAAVHLSTHLHPTATGPSGPPTAGT